MSFFAVLARARSTAVRVSGGGRGVRARREDGVTALVVNGSEVADLSCHRSAVSFSATSLDRVCRGGQVPSYGVMRAPATVSAVTGVARGERGPAVWGGRRSPFLSLLFARIVRWKSCLCSRSPAQSQ